MIVFGQKWRSLQIVLFLSGLSTGLLNKLIYKFVMKKIASKIDLNLTPGKMIFFSFVSDFKSKDLLLVGGNKTTKTKQFPLLQIHCVQVVQKPFHLSSRVYDMEFPRQAININFIFSVSHYHATMTTFACRRRLQKILQRRRKRLDVWFRGFCIAKSQAALLRLATARRQSQSDKFILFLVAKTPSSPSLPPQSQSDSHMWHKFPC